VPALDAVTVSPTPRFTATYRADQVEEIVVALAERREFPYEFTYFGDGSRLWRDQSERTRPDASGWLLTHHADAIGALFSAPGGIRVVDLGPGTGATVRGLLAHALAAGRLDRYVALDLSPDILTLAESNLRAWFPGAADRMEFHLGDLTGADLGRALAPPYGDGPAPGRLVVLAGGTLYNLFAPDLALRHVAGALRAGDVLVLTLRVEPPTGRPAVMNHLRTGADLKPQQRAGLDLLGIHRSWYDVELGHDERRSELFTRVRLLRPVVVTFAMAATSRTVALAAGDTITVWRYLYLTAADMRRRLRDAGLAIRLERATDPGDLVLVGASPTRAALVRPPGPA
jgi:L-histidine N-alpha-methyltransferase